MRLTLVLLLWPAQLAAGQAPATAPTGSVAGQVFGKADRPLSGVEITGPSTAAAVYTDSTGRFRIGLPAGDRHVTLRKLGYKPLSARVLVVAAAVTEVRLTLEPLPQEFDTVHVTARLYDMPPGTPPIMEDFYRRRKTGAGFYVTREDIDRHGSVRAALARAAGVRVLTSGSGHFLGVHIPRCLSSAFGGNRIAVFVDGQSVGTSWPGHDDDIEAIEVYRGPATMPAEAVGNACAAVFVWTRRRPSKR
jgi:hypothetical protein